MALPQDNHRLNTRKLLLELLRTTNSGWIPTSHFEQMAKGFGIPDGQPTIFFFTGLMQIVREIPLKIFDDITARSSLLDSLQGALDVAIEREEMREDDTKKIGGA